jgi:hypothetical protein
MLPAIGPSGSVRGEQLFFAGYCQETVMSLTAAVLSRASSSMGFPILAIDETFMDCCWSFETSLMKRSN